MRFFHPRAIVLDLIRLKCCYQQDLDQKITKDDGVELKWLHPRGASICDTRKTIKQKLKDIDRIISYVNGDTTT